MTFAVTASRIVQPLIQQRDETILIQPVLGRLVLPRKSSVTGTIAARTRDVITTSSHSGQFLTTPSFDGVHAQDVIRDRDEHNSGRHTLAQFKTQAEVLTSILLLRDHSSTHAWPKYALSLWYLQFSQLRLVGCFIYMQGPSHRPNYLAIKVPAE